MQVTGSNKKIFNNVLSIRLSPDGLSFWLSNGRGKLKGLVQHASFDHTSDAAHIVSKVTTPLRGVTLDKVALYVDTIRTLVVPSEILQPPGTEVTVEALLRFHNFTSQGNDESRLMIPLNDRATILTIAPNSLIAAFKEALGVMFEVRSPFNIALEQIVGPEGSDQPKCSIHTTPQNVYIVITGYGKLLYSEVAECSCEADILYYLGSLEAKYNISKGGLIISGYKNNQVQKLIKGYYKNIICV